MSFLELFGPIPGAKIPHYAINSSANWVPQLVHKGNEKGKGMNLDKKYFSIATCASVNLTFCLLPLIDLLSGKGQSITCHTTNVIHLSYELGA